MAEKKNIAVIYFPGCNCENESLRAVKQAGMDGRIFKWNEDVKELSSFDGFVIVGGFSYQDRIRAGAIAAKNPIMKAIMKEAEGKKPVIGICNGAQVLVETGLVPGINWGEVEMALATNRPRGGFLCRWVHLKRMNSCCFSDFMEEIIPMPMAHGEGRFTTTKKEVLDRIEKLIVFKYCDVNGKISDEYPINPNGAVSNAAAISNPDGNVMAIMPHPERSARISQLPDYGTNYSSLKEKAQGSDEGMKKDGPGMGIFNSMRKYLERNTF